MHIPQPILDHYLEMLPVGVAARCDPETAGGTTDEHLKWMLQTIPGLNDACKASRWLGFIQGVLILAGCTTVNEERDFTRPFFTQE